MIKDLLTALAVTSLGGSGAIIASHTANSPQTQNATATASKLHVAKNKTQFKANSNPSPSQNIINKITNKDISLPSDTNPDTSNAATIINLKNALALANPKLTYQDIAYLSFGVTTLVHGQKVSVVVTANALPTTASTIIKVTLHDNSKTIIAKLKNTRLVLPPTVKRDVKWPATVTTMKSVLKKQNPALNSFDLTALTFSQASVPAAGNWSVYSIQVQTNDSDSQTVTNNAIAWETIPTTLASHFDHITIHITPTWIGQFDPSNGINSLYFIQDPSLLKAIKAVPNLGSWEYTELVAQMHSVWSKDDNLNAIFTPTNGNPFVSGQPKSFTFHVLPFGGAVGASVSMAFNIKF